MEAATRDRHPVRWCAQVIDAALKDVAGVDPTFMGGDDKRAALLELTEVSDRVEALRMRVMAASGDVAEADGSRGIGAWVGLRTRTGGVAGRRAERLATALDARWAVLGDAVWEGRVNLPQARVITRVLDRLAETDEAPPDVLAKAEAHLVEEAARFDPAALERLADRMVQVIAPEWCDEFERKALERAHAKAEAETRLTFTRRGDGTTDIKARLADALAQRLKTYLEAWTSPRKDANDATDAGTRRADSPFGQTDPATGRRLAMDRLFGLAFGAFLEAFDPTRLPTHGGSTTQIIITIPFAELTAQVRGGVLTHGDDRVTLSAGETRRLACQAQILPAVLDGDSEVLDLGRSRRLFSGAQRKAHAVNHPVCQAEGCTLPWQWCEAHHQRDPWAAGGTTDLADLEFLCSWHHHRAHDPTYVTDRHADGAVRFHRRR